MNQAKQALGAGAWAARVGRAQGVRRVAALPLLPGVLALVGCAVLVGCAADGATPSCSEADLYQLRYDDDDEARAREILASDAGAEGLRELANDPDQDQAKLQQLADEKCVTAPGAIGTSN